MQIVQKNLSSRRSSHSFLIHSVSTECVSMYYFHICKNQAEIYIFRKSLNVEQRSETCSTANSLLPIFANLFSCHFVVDISSRNATLCKYIHTVNWTGGIMSLTVQRINLVNEPVNYRQPTRHEYEMWCEVTKLTMCWLVGV